jgi:hypothetical protein
MLSFSIIFFLSLIKKVLPGTIYKFLIILEINRFVYLILMKGDKLAVGVDRGIEVVHDEPVPGEPEVHDRPDVVEFVLDIFAAVVEGLEELPCFVAWDPDKLVDEGRYSPVEDRDKPVG